MRLYVIIILLGNDMFIYMMCNPKYYA